MSGAQGQLILVWAVMVLLLSGGMAALVNCALFETHRWKRWSPLRDFLLSSDPAQRGLILRYLIGLLDGMAGVLALNYGVVRGAIDAQACQHLTWGAIMSGVVWTVVLRSGLNKRLSTALAVELQVMTAIFFLAWGYQIGGPGKPVALMLLFIILMFCMFIVTTRQLVRCCVLSTLGFGMVFTRAAHEANGPFVAEMQLVYFGTMVIVLMSMCLLATHLSNMRVRAMKRKAELAEALARIRELAIRDELTGLFNRRHMLDMLNAERSRTARAGHPWCVCLLDIDHFKQINDRHGHGVGDEVLRSMGLIIQDGLRGSDQVARWGGEEFLIMFPDTSCEEATQVVTRIRQSLATSLISRTVPDLRATFSAGVTCFDNDEPMTQTIDRADQALYRAKAAGRNRMERLEAGHARPLAPWKLA